MESRIIICAQFCFAFILMLGISDARRNKGVKAEIELPPQDVPVVKCGDEIELACRVKGDPIPEVKWLFYGKKKKGSVLKKEIIREAGRDGRVKIKIEEFYVVQSTLLIQDAEEGDEGIYQCHASNSKDRNNAKINPMQHWDIEQAPVSKVKCKDAVTMQTQVFTASEYNQTVFDDVVERTMTSVNRMMSENSTSPEISDAKKKDKDNSGNSISSPPMKTQSVTSRTTTSLMTQKTPKVNNPKKPRKEIFVVDKHPLKKESRNMVEKDASKDKNVVEITDRQMASMSLTTEQNENGGDNSASAVFQRSWTLALLQVVAAAFLIMTSSG